MPYVLCKHIGTVIINYDYDVYSVSKIGTRYAKSEDFMKRNYNSLVQVQVLFPFNFQI